MAEIAEIFVHEPAVRRTGVLPLGAQVREMVGTSRNPLSSRKAKWAPSSAVFFYPGPHMLLPVPDRLLVPFPGPFIGFLATPSQALHQVPHIGNRIAHTEFAADHCLDALQRPEVRCVPRFHRALAQDTEQTFLLLGTQPGRTTGGRSRPKPSFAMRTEGLVPPHNRTQRCTDFLGHSAIRVAGLQEANRQQPSLLQAPGCTLGSHAPQYTILRNQYPFNNGTSIVDA